jgi:hypothetical protein
VLTGVAKGEAPDKNRERKPRKGANLGSSSCSLRGVTIEKEGNETGIDIVDASKSIRGGFLQIFRSSLFMYSRIEN